MSCPRPDERAPVGPRPDGGAAPGGVRRSAPGLLALASALGLALVTACGGGEPAASAAEGPAARSTAPESAETAPLDGPHEERWPNGRTKLVGHYRDGVPTGVFETWYEDGTPESRGAYLEGKKEGVWIQRDPSGAIDMERTGVYEDGVRIHDWWEEGIRTGELRSGLVQHSEYEHGLRNGRSRTFYSSGKLESAGQYANGLRTGVWVFWHEDGTLDPEQTGYYENHDKVRDLDAAELAAKLDEVER